VSPTIILIYLLLLALVSILSYRRGFQNIFRTEKSLPWYLAGFSVFLINPDSINILSKMGIVATEGYAGMWIFYTGVLGAGLLPIVFAPLWSRLKFMNDNQFILIRFSGSSAKVLHLFRAVYVGYLVVALFVAQIFIAMSKLLMVFFDISYAQSFLIMGILLLILIAKNSLQLKVRTDFLNGIIYLVAFAVGAYFVLKQFGGASEIYSRLNADYQEYTRLFPGKIDQTTFGSLPTLLVYFFIQWWSINILDGSGPEAQRFMNTKNPFQAFKAAFLPLILFSLAFLFHSFVIDAGILMMHDSGDLIPVIQQNRDLEASFIVMYKEAMPGGLATLIFLAFLTGFISFLEAMLNWGSSFLVVDVFNTYLLNERTDRRNSLLSYGLMVVIGITGLIIAWYNTHLLGLQKFIFSMAAGVGPVFILRWFWWRINAWSQLTAMISSLVLAVGWDLAFQTSDGFRQFIELQLNIFDLSYYAFKLLSLTILVSASWLIVTFLTKPDDPETLASFIDLVNPTGWWQGKSRVQKAVPTRKWLLLLLYPLISILPFLIIWQFKFGTTSMAVLMTLGWLALLFFTLTKMARMNK